MVLGLGLGLGLGFDVLLLAEGEAQEGQRARRHACLGRVHEGVAEDDRATWLGVRG